MKHKKIMSIAMASAMLLTCVPSSISSVFAKSADSSIQVTSETSSKDDIKVDSSSDISVTDGGSDIKVTPKESTEDITVENKKDKVDDTETPSESTEATDNANTEATEDVTIEGKFTASVENKTKEELSKGDTAKLHVKAENKSADATSLKLYFSDTDIQLTTDKMQWSGYFTKPAMSMSIKGLNKECMLSVPVKTQDDKTIDTSLKFLKEVKNDVVVSRYAVVELPAGASTEFDIMIANTNASSVSVIPVMEQKSVSFGDAATLTWKNDDGITIMDKIANTITTEKSDADDIQISEVQGAEKTVEDVDKSDFASKRLVAVADDKSVFTDADKIIGQYDNIYLLQYDTVKDTKDAYARLKDSVTAVEPDKDVTAATEATAEESTETTSTTEMPANTDTANAIDALNDMDASEPAQKEKGVIALIDTGVSKSENVIDSVSIIDDTLAGGVHGDKMLSDILSQDADAKVLSIRAMNDNGSGKISSLVAAMEYAIDQKVDYINLSLYARTTLATSVLEQEIMKATKAGIVVIGAAGNNGADVKDYVPGSVMEAYIIGAAKADGTRQMTSNFGDTVDYNVVADSTSDATALFTGYVSKNGLDSVVNVLNQGFIYGTDFFVETPDKPSKGNETDKSNPESTDKVEKKDDGSKAVHIQVPQEGGYVNVSTKTPLWRHEDEYSIWNVKRNIEGVLKSVTDEDSVKTEENAVYSLDAFPIKSAWDAKSDDISDSLAFDVTDKSQLVTNVKSDDVYHIASYQILSAEDNHVLKTIDDAVGQKAFTYDVELPSEDVIINVVFEKDDENSIPVHTYDSWLNLTVDEKIAYGKYLGVSKWQDASNGYCLEDSFFEGFSEDQLEHMNSIPVIYRFDVDDDVQAATVTDYNKISSNINGYTSTVGIFAVDGVTAFCCQHSKTTPGKGTPTTYLGEVNNDDLRKILYYNPYNGKAPWNSGRDSNYNIVVTSLAISHIYQDGGTIASYSKSALKPFFNYISGKSVPKDVRIYVYQSGSGSTQNLMTWEVKPQKGGLSVWKYSGKPELTNDNSNYSLEGAKFNVYTSNGTYVTQITTNKTEWYQGCKYGVAATGDSALDAGRYYVQEAKASPGYTLNSEKVWINVVAGQTARQNYAHFKEPPKLGSITVKKKSTLPNITDGNRCYSFKGAQYSVYTTKNANGTLDGLVGTITIGADGTGTLKDLAMRTYYVKETGLPKNKSYALDPTTYTATVSDDSGYTLTPTVTSKEKPENDPAYFEITKMPQDEITETIPTLNGTQFTIQYYDGYYTKDNLPSSYTRKWVVELKWNDDTNSYFAMLDTKWLVDAESDDLYKSEKGGTVLPLGTYVSWESKAAAGYTLEGDLFMDGDNTVYHPADKLFQQVKKKGDSIAISGNNVHTAKNKAKPSDIKIVKYKADGKTPLAGVTYELKNAKGEVVDTQKTDDKGIVHFKELHPDVYTVTEISAPEGYQLLKEPITVKCPMRVTKKDMATLGIDESKVTYDPADDIYYVFSQTFNVSNDWHFDMPHSGAMITAKRFIPIACGMVVLMGATCMMFFKKKKKRS